MVGAACWFIWSGVNLGGISRPRALKFVIQRIRSTTVKRDGAAGTLRPTGDQLLQLSYSDHRGRYGYAGIEKSPANVLHRRCGSLALPAAC